jgi:signal transduction histidine kinase
MLQAKTKNKIEIRKELTRQKITLKGNVGKLHQVFINILNNSIQAIPEKGTINISTKKVRQNLVVEIADTGTGIDEKDLKRITDPFFTTKDPGDGTGLGLFITYSIIKEHNGTLDFESQRGKGTKTIISFPVQG